MFSGQGEELQFNRSEDLHVAFRSLSSNIRIKPVPNLISISQPVPVSVGFGGIDPKHQFIEITQPVIVGIGSQRIGRECLSQNFFSICQPITIGVADKWIGLLRTCMPQCGTRCFHS